MWLLPFLLSQAHASEEWPIWVPHDQPEWEDQLRKGIGALKDMDGRLDEATGLIWQVNEPPELSWEDAGKYCADRAPNGISVRLPTLQELLSVTEHDWTDPVVNEAMFGDTLLDFYWTSSLKNPDDNPVVWRAWRVGLSNGDISTMGTNGATPFRCVFDLRTWKPPAERFKVETDIVTDHATGLIWQRGYSEQSVSYRRTVGGTDLTAPDLCVGLALDDARWRVPTVKELATLVEPQGEKMVLDPDIFGDTAATLWTSTPSAEIEDSGSDQYQLNSKTGAIRPSSASGSGHVRCVRATMDTPSDRVVRGSVFISGPDARAELEAFRALHAEVITGDLVIADTELVQLRLPELRHVGGDLEIRRNDALIYAQLHLLEQVDGDLILDDLPQLGSFREDLDDKDSIELDVLRRIGGNLQLKALDKMPTFRPRKLETIGDGLDVSRLDRAWELRFDNLTHIGAECGSVLDCGQTRMVQSQPRFLTLNLVHTLRGGLVLQGNPALERVNLTRLTLVQIDFQVIHNPKLCALQQMDINLLRKLINSKGIDATIAVSNNAPGANCLSKCPDTDACIKAYIE